MVKPMQPPLPTMRLLKHRHLPYAAIHNEGGMAGRNRSAEIPARPYMGFGDGDERELLELAQSMLLAQFSR